MSEEREQDRDANWVIKDFNLKGCEKVFSAACDDRQGLFATENLHCSSAESSLKEHIMCYQLNTDRFSTKGVSFLLPSRAVSKHQLLFKAFLSWFKNLYSKSVSGQVHNKNF